MYKILANGELIHASWDTNPDMAIGTPKLTVGLNKAGSLEFTMYPRHPLYDEIEKLNTLIEYYVDDEEVPMWYGRVLYTETDIWRQKKVCCEGALAFLLDSVQPYFDYTNVNPREFLVNCISHHNAQVVEMPDGADQTTEWYWNDGINYGPIDKRFYVGDVSIIEVGTKYHFNVTGFGGTHGTIIDTLIKTFGGYLTVTRDHSTGYWRNRLDWRMDYDDPQQTHNPQPFGEPNTQPVRYGLNLTDYTEDSQGMDVFTVLLPIGKDNLTLETKGKDGKTYNNGKMLIELTEQIATYGRILRSIEFNQIDDAKELYDAAMKYLYEHDWRAGPEKYTVKAVDLHNLNQNEEPLTLGKKATLVIEPVGIERTNLVITEIQYDLDNPENDQYIFSKPHREDASGGNGASVTGDYNGTSSSSGRVTSGGSNYQASNYEGIASQYGGLADKKDVSLSLKNVTVSVENLDAQINTANIGIADRLQTVALDTAQTQNDITEIKGTSMYQNRENLGLMAGLMTVVEGKDGQPDELILKKGTKLEVNSDAGKLEYIDSSGFTSAVIVQKINDDKSAAGIINAANIAGLTTLSSKVGTIEGSTLWTTRDTITGVVGKFSTDNDGNLVINSGSGLKITKNGTSYGVWDSNNLTGGIMVDQINANTTQVKINANRVDISGSTIDIGSNSSIVNLKNRVTNIENLSAGTSTIHALQIGWVRLLGDDGSTGYIQQGTGLKFSQQLVGMGTAISTTGNSAIYVLGNNPVSLNHTHIINITETEDGKFEVELRGAMKDNPDDSDNHNKATFDIGSTAYCKAAVRAVTVSADPGVTLRNAKYSDSGDYGEYEVSLNISLTNGNVDNTWDVTFNAEDAWKAGFAAGTDSEQSDVSLASLTVSNDTASGKLITRNTTDKTISFYPKYRLSSQTDGTYWQKITINDPGLYNDGWHGAYNKIARPATHTGNDDKTSFTIQIPQYAVDNQKTMPFSITSTSFSPSTVAGRKVKVNVLCTYDNQQTLAAVKTIDATDVYGYAWTQAVNGIVAPATYSGTTDKLSFKVGVPTDTIDDSSGEMYFSLTGGTFASGATSTVVYARQGDRIVALKNVDASGVATAGRNAGWAAAVDRVAPPSSVIGNDDCLAFNVSIPPETVDAAAVAMPFNITAGSFGTDYKAKVNVLYNNTTLVGRKTIDASGVYSSGWGDAYGKITLPPANTSNANAVLKIPSDVSGTTAPVEKQYQLSTNGTYPTIVYLKETFGNKNTVAQISTAQRSVNSVTINGSITKAEETGNYTVPLSGTYNSGASWSGRSIDITAKSTYTASSTGAGVYTINIGGNTDWKFSPTTDYNNGRDNGWTQAATKCAPPLKNTSSGDFSVTIPSASYGGADRTYNFSIACSFGATNTTAYAYAYYKPDPNTSISVARITVNGNGVYNLGYSAASSLVTLPEESSGLMAVVRYPTFIDNYRSAHNLNLTLSRVDNDGDGNPVNKVFLVGNNGPNDSNLNVAEILIPAPNASITFSDIVPTAQGSDPKRITATASVVNGTSTEEIVEVSAGIYGELTPDGSTIRYWNPIYDYNDGSPIYTYHPYVQKVGGSRADHEQRSFPATGAFYDGQVRTLVDSATLYQSASIANSTVTIPLKLTYNWAWQSTGENRVQTDKAVNVTISNSGYQAASDTYKKGNYNITIGGSNAFVVQPGGAWNAGWKAAQARCKPPIKNTSTNAFSVTIPNASAPNDPSVTTDSSYDFTITYGSVSNNKLPIYAKYGSVTVAQTTATVPSGSEPSASTIDLSNFGWAYSQQDVLNASPAGSVAQSQLTTLVNLLTSHKGQTGYIYFDARCGSGNTFKRYYLKNPT